MAHKPLLSPWKQAKHTWQFLWSQTITSEQMLENGAKFETRHFFLLDWQHRFHLLIINMYKHETVSRWPPKITLSAWSNMKYGHSLPFCSWVGGYFLQNNMASQWRQLTSGIKIIIFPFHPVWRSYFGKVWGFLSCAPVTFDLRPAFRLSSSPSGCLCQTCWSSLRESLSYGVHKNRTDRWKA